jgi:hypothetical protein
VRGALATKSIHTQSSLTRRADHSVGVSGEMRFGLGAPITLCITYIMCAGAAIHIHHAVDRSGHLLYIEGAKKRKVLRAVIRALRLRPTWPCFPSHNLAALLYMLGNIDCIMLCYAFVCLYLLNIRSLVRSRRRERLSTLNSCSNLAAGGAAPTD